MCVLQGCAEDRHQKQVLALMLAVAICKAREGAAAWLTIEGHDIGMSHTRQHMHLPQKALCFIPLFNLNTLHRYIPPSPPAHVSCAKSALPQHFAQFHLQQCASTQP